MHFLIVKNAYPGRFVQDKLLFEVNLPYFESGSKCIQANIPERHSGQFDFAVNRGPMSYFYKSSVEPYRRKSAQLFDPYLLWPKCALTDCRSFDQVLLRDDREASAVENRLQLLNFEKIVRQRVDVVPLTNAFDS